MLLKLDEVRKGFHAQGANRNVPQEEMPLNMSGNSQGANRIVPQEELLLTITNLGQTLVAGPFRAQKPRVKGNYFY